MNVLFAGDPAQLPPPRATSLYDQNLVKCYLTQNLNALNENIKHDVEGLCARHQVDKCVMLTQIMRQKEKAFQDILSRLRFGNCSEADFAYLQPFIAANCSDKVNHHLLSLQNWIDDPDHASPLICYTNAVRDAHNMKASQAFAKMTRQEFHVYHSTDSKGKGKNKYILQNAAAKAAWNGRVKDAKDLSGHLPLIPGMPVFLTENIATEIGLSNGSEGKLISVKYEIRESKRYAVSVDVDFKAYNNPNNSNPHRVTLAPITGKTIFRLPGSDKQYSATRRQIPLIPGFSYTAHNSQGRSLNAGCIDFVSCTSIACAYVMLSRLRKTEGLSILRPFPFNKIHNHAPQDMRNELND